MLNLHRVLSIALFVGLFQLNASAQKVCPLTKGECPLMAKAMEKGVHEIGINAVSWINADLGLKGPKGGDMSYGNGILYKLHCDKGALRAGVDLFHFKQRYGVEPNGADLIGSNGFYKSVKTVIVETRMGIERQLCTSRLQPFVGADLACRVMKKTGSYENYQGDLGYPSSGDINSRSHHFIVAPFFGLRFRATDHFSVSAEGSYSLGIGKTMDDVTGAVKKNDFLSTANPLRTFSVNYHF